ncbi:hypothetical protein KIK84_14500 [Curvibacter sp. CHRR-16]|uniref:hypothetical protein n=1 Tax=Curvibacter sp. CHRR-16 TaxID=2835872 RepID=UPI001BD9A6D6|nr:hypothetical protein [Curvibacter sp. CHRR-16]MBT0571536.1 hypothetical protein [Curvibacter sp. CHRR-16]
MIGMFLCVSPARLACLSWVALVACAHAQSSDVITYRAGLSSSSTNNFLRTSGANAKSEQTTTETVGVKVSLPVSQQTFDLDASLAASQHQNNRNFDYTAQNYQLSWLWTLTPRWHGSLGSQQSETLNTPSDSSNQSQRNKNTKQSSSFQLAYDLGSYWQFYSGLVNSRTTNEQNVVGQTDSRSTGAQLGARFVSGSSNSIDVGLQSGKGVSNSDFSYDAATVSTRIAVGGRSWLTGKLGQTRQRFDSTPQFNFDGPSASIGLTWGISGKLSMASSWQRDAVGYQTTGTTYTQNDVFVLAPMWHISSKSGLGLTYKNTVRADKGSPNGISSTRQDTTQDITLSYNWQPRKMANFVLSYTDSSRSSNVAGVDYHAEQIDLTANIYFY